MFDTDRSDEENAELVKEWMARHLPVIFAGIVIALLIIFGMKWWEKRQLEASYRLSYQLDILEKAVEANQAAAVKAAYTTDLATSESNYGDLAALLVAQHYQQNQQFKEAIALLERASSAKDTLVAQTAQWQLAHSHIALENYDAANAALEGLANSIYQPQLAIVRGDIHYLRGDYQAALANYQQSQVQQASPLIDIRIRQLQAQLALQPN